MALAATMVWEIQPASGAANNGGGFNSAKTGTGTDYSQVGATPHVAVDNSTITATTAGANSNVMTLSGYTVAATDEGNVFCAVSGTNINAGVYEISSVDTGANTWTLTGAQNLTTAGGAGSAIVGNMGGSLSGFSTGTTPVQGVLLAGHTVWIKNEAWNEPVSLTVSGTTASPIKILGYNTARDDKPTGTSRPVLDRASAGTIAMTISGAYYVLEHFRITRAGTAGIAEHNVGHFYRNVRIDTCGSVAMTRSSGSISTCMVNCEIDNNSTGGLVLNGGACYLHGNYIHDNGGLGWAAGTSGVSHVLTFNIVADNTSHGVAPNGNGGTGANVFLVNNTIDHNTGGSTNGLNLAGFGNNNVIYNNIFSNNGNYGAASTSAGTGLVDYNNYYANTAARSNVPTGDNDIALDPAYTATASHDYSVGTNMKAAAFPGTFPAT